MQRLAKLFVDQKPEVLEVMLSVFLLYNSICLITWDFSKFYNYPNWVFVSMGALCLVDILACFHTSEKDSSRADELRAGVTFAIAGLLGLYAWDMFVVNDYMIGGGYAMLSAAFLYCTIQICRHYVYAKAVAVFSRKREGVEAETA